MAKNNFSKFITFSLCFFSAIALFYSFYKAYNNSFTHDESYTYNFYVNDSLWNIITYFDNHQANNHILNTILMKWFQFFFGSSEFVLRLPNLLAHLMYLIFTILWLKKLNNDFILLIGFIALNLNPYLLDFFALARGYGLSVCFMFISFYFFYKYIFSLNMKDSLISFLCAALAVLSNFVLLDYYLSLSVIFNVFLLQNLYSKNIRFIQKVKNFFILNIPAISISILLALVILKPLQAISGDLIGQQEGFYTNTMRSIIYCSTFGQFHYAVSVICFFFFAVAIFSLGFYSFDLIKSGFNLQKSPHLLILMFAVLPSLSIIIQHSLLNTPFLENRTGLFFIVLFNISFIYLIYFLFSRFKKIILASIFSFLYPTLLLFNFIYNYRLHYYNDWAYDAGTKKMLTLLNEDRLRSPKIKSNISLGITWIFEPAITFYKKTKKLDWLNDVNRNGYDGSFDYYYVYDDRDFIEKNKKIIISEFAEGKSILARNP